jgi:hypothetical protein
VSRVYRCTRLPKVGHGTTHSRNKALDDVCVCRKFWVASKEAPILYLSVFLALAHEAIPAIAPPELFDRMAYVNKPAQLTTNVYFQHTYQLATLPRRRASRFLRGYLQMCTYRYTHISHLPDLQSRPRIHTSTQPTDTGIRQRRGGEGGNCGAVTQIIAWFARARSQGRGRKGAL